MPKARPKTGEPRDTHQPLKIDKLPEAVHEAITLLRNRGRGLTWEQLEARSAMDFNPKWDKENKGGFVDWHSLPLDILELFPDMRLPKSNLHRWYDLRRTQVRDEVIQDGNAAAKFVEQLAELKIPGMNDAVMNAMVREVFGLINGVGVTDKAALIGTLSDVSLVLTRIQRLQLQKEKVSVEERKLHLLEKREKLAIQKLEAETDRLAKKARNGKPITEEELKSVRMKAFGF